MTKEARLGAPGWGALTVKEEGQQDWGEGEEDLAIPLQSSKVENGPFHVPRIEAEDPCAPA